MLHATAAGVVRRFGGYVRLADATLTSRAARNAESCLAQRRALHLEEARTMRDLRRLAPAAPPASRAVGS